MSTIAFDGAFLAADSFTEYSGCPQEVVKLALIKDYAIGMIGDGDAGREAIAFLKGEIKERPNIEDSLLVLVHKETLNVTLLRRKLYPEELKPSAIQCAFGSGAYAALAAMKCGRNAIEAVRIACEIDGYSKPPIRYIDMRSPEYYIVKIGIEN